MHYFSIARTFKVIISTEMLLKTVTVAFAIIIIANGHDHAVSYNNNHLHSKTVHGYNLHHDDYHAYPRYSFKYGVNDGHTGDDKEQHEERDGDRVKGFYKVHEPDGTIRIVHYTADKHNGFRAHVERRGHAIHPYHKYY